MKRSLSCSSRAFAVLLATALCAGLVLVACHATPAFASPATDVPPTPRPPPGPPQGQAQGRSSGVHWDFSVTQKWHLCAPGDLDDCTLQCERGHLPSCVRLGNIYFEGKRVPKDLARAAELYELPCTFHLAEACFNRGQIYASEHDAEHAAKYLSRACDGGLARGCGNLGIAYEAGDGVARDAAHAAALYKTACDGGDMRGCSNLGVLYMNGDGDRPDPVAAAHLFETACTGGNAGACGNLGSCYESGRGEVRDPTRAAELPRQACDGGAKAFCR